MVLDGERGRRPHWKSTEQLLTQAVSRGIRPCNFSEHVLSRSSSSTSSLSWKNKLFFKSQFELVRSLRWKGCLETETYLHGNILTSQLSKFSPLLVLFSDWTTEIGIHSCTFTKIYVELFSFSLTLRVIPYFSFT